MKKTLSLLLCIFLLVCPMSVSLAENSNNSIFYEGDSVIFIGDSITHSGQYGMYIENYYATRFPGKKIVFNNCGVTGDSASGALSRFDRDIASKNPTKATIMFGMNDINRYAYKDGATNTEEQKQGYITSCLANIEAIAKKLTGIGAFVTIITPSIYDQTVESTAENMFGCNDALGKVALGGTDLAAKNGYGLIDFHGTMNKINNDLQAKDKTKSIIGTDRIHPAAMGHYIMAYQFLKQQGAPSVVSDVYFNVLDENKNVYDNNDVDGLLYNEENVICDYNPKALPIYANSEYNSALAYVPVTEDLNREFIKVEGLKDGDYTISMDGAELLKTNATELQKGINIAVLANNPGQIQSKKIMDACSMKNSQEQKLRLIERCEMWMLSSGVDINNIEKVEEYIKNASPSMPAYNAGLLSQYVTTKKTQAKTIEDINGYREKIQKDALPTTHKLEIKLIGGTNVPVAEPVSVNLSDIDESWAKDTIVEAVTKKIVSGYPDGTFKPENNINVDEFIKVLLGTAKYKIKPGSDYWAQPYIDAAIEAGIVAKGEFDKYDRFITRAEIARMLARATVTPTSISKQNYIALIKDYDEILAEFKTYVLSAYAEGYVKGNPDGTFTPNANATRAEAVVMVMRAKDKIEK